MRRPSEKEEGEDREGRRDGRGAGGKRRLNAREWTTMGMDGKKWQTVARCGREREGTARRCKEVNKNGDIDD